MTLAPGDHISAGLAATDAAGVVTFADAELARLCACAAGDLVGRPVAGLFDPAGVPPDLWERCSSPEGWSGGLTVLAGHGRRTPVHVSAAARRDARGRVQEVLFSCAFRAGPGAGDDARPGEAGDAQASRRTADGTTGTHATCGGVFDNIQDAYFRVGPDGRIVRVSRSAAAMFGYDSPADMAGMPATALWAEAGARDEVVARLRESGYLRDLERLAVRRDGTAFWTALSIQSVAGEDGGYQGTETLARDVDERVRAEEALRRSEAHFRAFFEGASVGMATSGADQRWIDVNDALCRMLGYARDELTAMTWADVTHPDDLETNLAAFEAVLRGERETYSLDKRYLRRDGSVLHGRLVAHAVRDDAGRVDSIAHVIEDVSERVSAEEELRRLNAELERRVEVRTAQLQQTNRELESFAYSISHDLRTPLRALDGFSEIVCQDYRDVLDEEGRRHLQRIRGAAQRMGRLIDGLLALSRVSRRELVLDDVDLSAMARRIGERLRRADPGRSVELAVAPGCRARTDGPLAEALLGNLLDNAWKFTAGRDPAHIEVGCTSEEGQTVFFVKDDGAGFDTTYADKLFQPFQRLHPAEQYPGTGIGLASVHRIVSRLGGRCWAEGVPGRGATFCFTLGLPPA